MTDVPIIVAKPVAIDYQYKLINIDPHMIWAYLINCEAEESFKFFSGDVLHT